MFKSQGNVKIYKEYKFPCLKKFITMLERNIKNTNKTHKKQYFTNIDGT